MGLEKSEDFKAMEKKKQGERLAASGLRYRIKPGTPPPNKGKKQMESKLSDIILGRPIGRKSSKTKLTGQEKKIQDLLDKNVSYSAIGRILGVHRLTVSTFAKERL
ncbi:hypothetical protein [Pedobacter sp. BS3]|uniref:hypothetical protein n=1 Tax=Pedobacter sp. BS3 TaxID=2567937 RepID=UPI0018D9947E|nr:hypothetical protein [Pedobacter sp. BS3]